MNHPVRRAPLGRHFHLEDRLAPTADPLFPAQWHLENLSQSGGAAGEDYNVRQVWEEYAITGFGVVVGVVDDGLQVTHPDLVANYLATHSRDFFSNDLDPSPNLTTDDVSGTASAGLIAAVGDNELGGAGVAYRAGLAGLRISDGTSVTSNANIASAFTFHPNDIDIYASGWGPVDDGVLQPANPTILAALQTGFNTGRGGLGNIFVWGSGDGRLVGDDVNYNAYANSRYVIAVAAIDDFGIQAEYSEPGAAILVSGYSGSAPGTELITTDLVGADGLDPSDYTTAAAGVSGTSAAAAGVAGVVALMLEANPNLTARDVQDILVRTARQNDGADIDWTTKATANGTNLNVNHKYGFGAVDAFAAVSLARTYALQGPEIVVQTPTEVVNEPIPDNDLPGVVSFVDVDDPEDDIIVDRVEVKFRANHSRRGDLNVTLTSPEGTVSVLADTHDDTGDNYNWTFSTVRNWGEGAGGTWTLEVSDLAGGAPEGTFQDWQLILHGVSRSPFLSGIGTTPLTYFENQLDLVVGAGAGIADPDSFSISGATVSISGGFPEDVLLFEDQYGITGEYLDGVLTLSGAASAADYDLALRSVRYRNTSEDPNLSGRTLTFQAFDEEENPSNVFTRTLNVLSINDVPSFSVGPNVSVLQDSGAQTIDPWAIDILPGPPEESDQTVTFIVTNVSNPGLFSVAPSVSPAGVLTFTPAAGQVGQSTVELVVRDNGGTANGGIDESAVQSFTITVAPRPVAGPDFYTTTEDESLTVPAPGILVNDTRPGPSPLVAVLVSHPEHGNLFLNSNGGFTYTPDPDFAGTDTFIYKASDGSLESLPTPVTIRVLPVNDSPVAVDDTAETPAGRAVVVNVLANDTDVDGDGLRVGSFTAPAQGRVTRSGTALKYTPNAGYDGTDTFTYTVLDGRGGSDTALVTVAVMDTTRPTLTAVRVGYGNTVQDLRGLSRTILPWAGVRRFEFAFSEGVTVGPSALTLTGPSGVVPLTFTPPGVNRTAVWTVIDPEGLDIGRYTMRLTGGLVSDANGNTLAGGYVRTFGLLPGDFDGNGLVSAADVTAIRQNAGKVNRFADVNGDGVINQADEDAASANLNRRLG